MAPPNGPTRSAHSTTGVCGASRRCWKSTPSACSSWRSRPSSRSCWSSWRRDAWLYSASFRCFSFLGVPVYDSLWVCADCVENSSTKSLLLNLLILLLPSSSHPDIKQNIQARKATELSGFALAPEPQSFFQFPTFALQRLAALSCDYYHQNRCAIGSKDRMISSSLAKALIYRYPHLMCSC